MGKLVKLPREALEGLLREAGHPESVETFLASETIHTQIRLHDNIVKRAKAAYWSRYWLLFSAFTTWIALFFEPDIEGVLSAILLTGMTVVEYKVYHLFQAADLRATIYGWWNQCLFAALFLIYGLYHATFITPLPNMGGLINLDSFTHMERMAYLAIGILGGLGQFRLAWYYRSAAAE